MIDVRAKKKLGEFLLDAELHDEGFICLTGRNGSGKSTFLNIIAGVIPLDDGSVKLHSNDITNMPMENRGVVLVTPDSYIPHLSVNKHLVWGAKLVGRKLDPSYVEKVKSALGISYGDKLSKLSLGMRERVSLATVLLAKPRLILIDETFSNVDARDVFISEFRKLCSESNLEAIFTTQFQEDSSNADHQYLIEAGKMKKVF
jgi:molybdate/tungstate transport system ATP-binding protein